MTEFLSPVLELSVILPGLLLAYLCLLYTSDAADEL